MGVFIFTTLLLPFLFLGCVGPVSLHQAVISYDETISQLEREILLLNVARAHHNLPNHFTVTASIAATFDYRANAGFTGNLLENPSNNLYSLSLGASAAENPTLSIIPVQGEDFTKRILTPMDEGKFGFQVFQGAPLDMVMRMMADGIEVQNTDGTFQRFILNWPTVPAEYEEFRRRAMHLVWLNTNRKLFVGPISYKETVRAELSAPPTAGDVQGALEKGYAWQRSANAKEYELTRDRVGRVAITNYDLRTLTDEQRRELNARAAANPSNFVLVDIRPGHPGGDFPLFGAVKLRSLNVIIAFLAAGIAKNPEYPVEKDPRTGSIQQNPMRALAIEETGAAPADPTLSISYADQYYSVANNPWDRQAFKLLYQLFQMTVTDVSQVGVPVTISK